MRTFKFKIDGIYTHDENSIPFNTVLGCVLKEGNKVLATYKHPSLNEYKSEENFPIATFHHQNEAVLYFERLVDKIENLDGLYLPPVR